LILAAILWPIIAKAFAEKENPLIHSSDPTGLALVSTRGIFSKSATADISAGLHVTPDTSGVRAYKPPEAPKRAVVRSVDATLARIAICESQGNLHAKNPRSTATGKYQFLKGSWNYYGTKLWGSVEGKDIFSEEDQDELAKYVVSINGYRDWNASKHCWSN